ncbi:MAG: hypothetical protein HIU84_13870 [Acidobacteria bacterium]|nr:hypothetical protein [Acidobacteriota bacterium]
MRRAHRPLAVFALSSVLVVGVAIVAAFALSSAPTYVRPPLLCGANGMALHGPDVWVSGCVFKNHSAFSARIPAIVEFNATNGSLMKVVKDPVHGNDGPQGLTVSGSRVWVANGNGNSIVELNATNGSLVRVIKSKADRLKSPWMITASGSRVWVFNEGNSSITELNASNGALVRVINAKADQLVGVNSINVAHSHLWLTNGTYAHDSVIELNAGSGSLVRVINAKAGDFNLPSALAMRNSKVWVTSAVGPVATTPLANGASNFPGGSVSVLTARSGSLVRVITTATDAFYGPAGIAVGHSHVWVTNGTGGTITELNASNGALVRVIKVKALEYGSPSTVIVRGSRVWVLDSAVLLSGQSDVWGGAVTELNASNGSLRRIIR